MCYLVWVEPSPVLVGRVWREGKRKIMGVVSYFKYMGSCSSKDGGPREEVKMRVSVGLNL